MEKNSKALDEAQRKLREMVGRLENDHCHHIPAFVLEQIDKRKEVDEIGLDPRSGKSSRAIATVSVVDDVFYVKLVLKSSEYGPEPKVFAIHGTSQFTDFMVDFREEVKRLID